MSAARLDSDARSLFAAAREDGPNADERDALFRRLALATGVAAGTAAAATALSAAPPAAASAAAIAGVASAGALTSAGVATSGGAVAGASAGAGTFGMKLLAFGALIGTVSTALGVLIAVTVVTPDGSPAAREKAKASGSSGVDVGGAVAGGTRAVTPGARLAEPSSRRRDPTANADARSSANSAGASNESASANTTSANTTSANTTSANARRPADPPSDLGEEARLVTAARTALVAGDAARALSLVQATRKLGARALEPEELSLEARALRALGRADEAAATELDLRRRYPDHALAR